MFAELEEETIEVGPDSPDRHIVWAIWAKPEDSSMTPEEGWGILHERYPDDPRFLLLAAYTELSETRKHSEGRIKIVRATQGAATSSAKVEVGAWSPAYFLKRLERLVDGVTEGSRPQVKDLVLFGNTILTLASGGEAKVLADLRKRAGFEGEPEPSRDDRDRAGIRLRRFEREVLKELEERTQENRPLGTRAPAAPQVPAGSEWASAVADASKPRKKYAADARYGRGELVEHPKFGVGVVTGTEPGKAVILFESGVRKLVAGS